MSKVELEVTPAPAQKQDPLQWVTSKMRKACLELEAEAKAALPEGSFLHTIYVSEALARGGYSLARKYNTNVCNGMTIILVVHPLSVEIFASVCSKEDTYTRLDGRFEALKRLALKYNKSGVLPVEMTPLSIHVEKVELAIEGVPETLETVVRGAVNLFIKEQINSKAKPKSKAFVPSREQLNQAEQNLIDALKSQNSVDVDFRLTYQYRVPKTGMRSVMMRPYNVKAGTDVAFEETTVKLIKRVGAEEATVESSAMVTRYVGDANNRLAARWFALKKLAKQVQRKDKRPKNV